MTKKRIKILFVALICAGVTGGHFTVICRGSDGHVALEPAVHNHCRYHRQSLPLDSGGDDQVATAVYADRGRCRDIVLGQNVTVLAHKTFRLSIYKAFAANPAQEQITASSVLVAGLFAGRHCQLSSFHAPLRTVILLA